MGQEGGKRPKGRKRGRNYGMAGERDGKRRREDKKRLCGRRERLDPRPMAPACYWDPQSIQPHDLLSLSFFNLQYINEMYVNRLPCLYA